jgi:Ankyrin repeats (3 copies)
MRANWYCWNRQRDGDWDVVRQGETICGALHSLAHGFIKVLLVDELKIAGRRRFLFVVKEVGRKESELGITALVTSVIPWPISFMSQPPENRTLNYMDAYVHCVASHQISGVPFHTFKVTRGIVGDPDGMSDGELWELALKHIKARNVMGLCSVVRRNPGIVGQLVNSSSWVGSEIVGDEDRGPGGPFGDRGYERDLCKWLDESRIGLRNLVHEAVIEGYSDALNALLCANPGLLESRDGKGNTPLHLACGTVRTECISTLLDWGADVNAYGGCRGGDRGSTITPLLMAAMATSQDWIKTSEFSKMFDVLFKRGADQWVKMLVKGVDLSVPRIVAQLRGARFVNMVLSKGNMALVGTCSSADGKTVIDDCPSSERILKVAVNMGDAKKEDVERVQSTTSCMRVKRLIKTIDETHFSQDIEYQ